VYIYINRAPGKALASPQREFLRYILSREGQEAVARSGNYLPLTREVVAEERRRLDGGR
jgi:phosphate transport system substrate-binding protein